MTYNPKVSIVIPAYNASNYLAEAIDSALAQTYQNIEIIVVNDGSKDNGATQAVAEKYGDKIRYYKKENGGSSSALNRGVQEMTGEWFSWLSHDDLYYPNKVKEQVEYLSNLGITQAELKDHVLFAGAERIDSTGKTMYRPNQKKLNQRFLEVKQVPGNQYFVAEPNKFTFHGCSCLIHKTVFEKIGMFDESLRLINDIDMWYRIFVGGYKIHYIPKVLVKGRMHAKQVSRGIAFSCSNSEQDMSWDRMLNWLIENHPSEYILYVKFAANAFFKGRKMDGKKAIDFAIAMNPKRKIQLKIVGLFYLIKGYSRTIAKKIYMRIRL